MIDKITNWTVDNFSYIFGATLIVLVALVGYNLGSESNKNKICKQLGGVYVQTWSDGYRCIMNTEIDL